LIKESILFANKFFWASLANHVDVPFSQLYLNYYIFRNLIHLMNSNNLTNRKSISQSRDEIESEVYDKFWSTKSLREEMDGIQSIIDKCEKPYNKTGDLPALKVVLDDYTSSREIVEEFEEGMYSNGYCPTVSAFTPEQVAHPYPCNN
jgi:hypothetical protein